MTLNRRDLIKAGGTGIALAASAPLATMAAQSGGNEKILRWGYVTGPTSLNPLMHATGGAEGEFFEFALDCLVRYDSSYNVVGTLAESWEFSDDGASCTFNLRPNAAWQDGEPFTTEDVVFTVNLALNPKTNSVHAPNLKIIQGAADYAEGSADSVSGMQVNGDQQITFSLTNPSAVFLDLFTKLIMLPKHALESIAPEDFEKSDFATKTLNPGIGPFVLEAYEPDQYALFTANPTYWGGKPNLDGVRLDIIPDNNTRLLAFESGEIDMVDNIFASTKDRVGKVPGAEVLDALSVVINFFAFNLHPDLDDDQYNAMRDSRFRQAFLYALNREAVIKVRTTGVEGATIAHDCMSVFERQCPDDLVIYDNQPDKARELLEEIGWNSDWTVKMMLWGTDPSPDFPVMQQMWGESGIKVELQPTEIASVVGRLRSGDFDLWLAGLAAAPDPMTWYSTSLSCEGVGSSNFYGFCDPDFDEIVSTAMRTPDPEQFDKLTQQANAILNKDLTLSPVWIDQYWIAVGARVDGSTINYGSGYTWKDAAKWSFK